MKKAFTKEIISWYNFGAFILFLGLLWMFLPHAAHEIIIQENNDHILHVFEGAAVAITGIGLMILDRRKHP